MRRFKNLFNEAIEADDISVGKKKKVPAGIKVDPNLKGYAYNEKRVTDIDVEQGERDLKLAKLKKAKDKVQNEDEFKPHMMYDPKTGKGYKAEVEADHERMSKLGYTHEKPEVKENYNQDLNLATKNIARLANKETGQDKKDYQAVSRALAQGNLGAVKKVIKGISTKEIQSDLLNILVGYNALIAKMYPKAMAGGKFKTGMTVDKIIKEENMSLDDIKKRYAKEIIAFQDGDGELSHGAKMAMHGYVGSDAIKTDDPDEFDKFVMGLQMGKYKKTNEQEAMDTLLDMLDETNLDEALSPKEKEKRLQMIKKAVEKLNRANLEKVKRMAMRDMKASGMFDDAMDEHVKGGGDSYDALQKAKGQAKKQGKVWDRLGKDEKDRLIDKEMVALGYEKKPGNSQYTKIPTEKEKAFADKVKADDDKVRKMSDKDKTQYYIDNPNKSQGGDDVSAKGQIKIQISKYEAVVQKYDDFAQKAMEKAYEAEEKGDDMAFEKYQDEEQAYQDKADSFRRKVEELKDKLSDME